MNEITMPDIAQGETAKVTISPGNLAAGYESRSYRIGIAASPTSASLVTKLFGPSEYASGVWTVELTPTQTSALPLGEVFLGVWEIDRPEPVAFASRKVGRVPGSS